MKKASKIVLWSLTGVLCYTFLLGAITIPWHKLISKEDPKNPLADEKLCELLKQEIGVDIARRTVAKYRTALNIPSSSKRKQRF